MRPYARTRMRGLCVRVKDLTMYDIQLTICVNLYARIAAVCNKTLKGKSSQTESIEGG